MTLTVTVTQKHIDKGVRGACAACPIALALTAQHKDRGRWGVGCGKVWTYDLVDGEARNTRFYELPKPAREFINAFDGNKPVAPFTFELEVGE